MFISSLLRLTIRSTGTAIFLVITSLPKRVVPQLGHAALNENGTSPGLASSGAVTLRCKSIDSPLFQTLWPINASPDSSCTKALQLSSENNGDSVKPASRFPEFCILKGILVDSPGSIVAATVGTFDDR